MKKIKSAKNDLPIDVVDGIDDVRCSLECLAQTVECISVAVSSELEDSTEYIEGTIQVLLQSVRAAEDKARMLQGLIRS